MGLKSKIAIMQFLEFIAWGSWLITIGAYCFNTKHWSAAQFGTIYSTTGIAALFMPAIGGIIADRWINAEKLFGYLHFGCAACMICVPFINDPSSLFWLMFVNMCFYMPTIPLTFSISYNVMEGAGMDIIKEFPPLRVFGTIGFAAGMWTTSLAGLETSAMQFYISAASSIVLAFFAFSMPKCPPLAKNTGSSWISLLGLDALKLFKSYKMALFFVFSMLLGVCMQLSNAYADSYIHDFRHIAKYADSLVIKYPAIIVSLGQISEMGFILVVPFVLRKYGMRKVMIMSTVAWVLRWILLAYGNPGMGFPLILMSMLVWGMAFDFFNLSGSLFIETQVDPSIRSSAQGLFQMMVVGVGAVIGSIGSGWLIDTFFTHNGLKDWHGIMWVFAIYSFVVAVAFFFLFKHEHKPEDFTNFKH
jgi:MFS transporter, NHS family, xanthosine permease